MQLSHQGRVAHIVFTRPACRNSLTEGIMRDLIATCHGLQLYYDVSVVVLRGQGRFLRRRRSETPTRGQA